MYIIRELPSNMGSYGKKKNGGEIWVK